ncbi:hypothetical protein LHFGNBLO_001366 [Mesorhizobium sp. AR10]|uniref:hypothetical protein n=1 Tax=Mesorhizobium sp. AR10 TaxID=2865839 RepID=UPI00215FEB58|nr:hypothetical protein [Mesorhizobium sp. AR10]UVK39951.1 hypothetical protein LHFGNBLO_001366 [Mesorhizobium sp. AR10]
MKVGINISLERIQLAWLTARATSEQRSVSSVLREVVQRAAEADFAQRKRIPEQGGAR